MSTIDNIRKSFGANDDNNNNASLNYYPEAHKYLTMEQQLQLKVTADSAKKASKEQLFMLFLDLYCLHYNTINVSKKMFKGDLYKI